MLLYLGCLVALSSQVWSADFDKNVYWSEMTSVRNHTGDGIEGTVFEKRVDIHVHLMKDIEPMWHVFLEMDCECLLSTTAVCIHANL